MTATHHEWSRSTEQVRLRGGDLEELAAVVAHFAAEADESARWFIDGDVLVLKTPLSEMLVGGKPYRIPKTPLNGSTTDAAESGTGPA